MKIRPFRPSMPLRIVLVGLQTVLVISALSCSSNETKVRQAIEDRLKGQGIRNLVIDLFHPSKKIPGKAYASATVTYNFATSSGAFQQEYLGFILKQDGSNWTIDQPAGYTKEPEKAENFLAGNK